MDAKGYIEDVATEMKKVSWPKRQELISNTTITLVATLILSVFIYFTDRVISGALSFIYG